MRKLLNFLLLGAQGLALGVCSVLLVIGYLALLIIVAAAIGGVIGGIVWLLYHFLFVSVFGMPFVAWYIFAAVGAGLCILNVLFFKNKKE